MIRWQEHRGSAHVPFKRAKVLDGWMVWSDYGPGKPGKMTFYKDPSFDWDGTLVDLA